MPIATPKQFAAMLDNAQEKGCAYPAINVVNANGLNAAMKAFEDHKTDGIIQFSTGAGQFTSGLKTKDATLGCRLLAELAHGLAEQYDVLIALNTDHCQPEKAKGFLDPLIAASAERKARGQNVLFQNHMLDASILPLEENMALSRVYLARCAELGIILEVEAGVVGGEEDGAAGTEDTPEEKLYTSPEEMVAVHEALAGIGRFTFAATFGNVHGSYKPGAVKLKPTILRDGQAAVTEKYGADARFDLVFHGGSGSRPEEILETLGYGVVKMNVDTDTQYAFTRPVVNHMCTKIESVLKIDGEIGSKKEYDPRTYLKKGEEAMGVRVGQAIRELRCEGTSIYGQDGV